MKRTLLFLAACVVIAGLTAQMRTVSLEGYIGQRYKDCMDKRVKTENIDTLISVFKVQDEVRNQWGSEFWGKWVQGAIGMYHYTHDAELKQIINNAENRLVACQLPNGYIGDYDARHQLTAWDVWGRKYTLLGLIKWYWETGDRKFLKAATRLLDYTLSQVGLKGKSISKCGLYKGMPPMSILEPVMYLYDITRDKRYLDFAKYIVADGESADGPQLLAKADVPVARRFPLTNPGLWWSEQNGQKAYEMMSCYVGMLELYRVTHDARLLTAAQTVYKHIIEEEINICGSGASYECWYGGRAQQTRVALHTMETCVTFTWMQFCERLLEFTEDPLLADQIERTMYNALMASMKGDASQIVKYTPLEGYRHEGEEQCGLPINCCNANAPRAFAMLPRVMYRLSDDDRLDINLYIPSSASIRIGKQTVQLQQETNYPEDGNINIRVNLSKPAEFTVALRIPAWSHENTIKLNNEQLTGIQQGTYFLLKRKWKSGDVISLSLQVQARLIQQDNFQAIERGPVVLARDSRFNDGFVDECCVIPTHDGSLVDLERVPSPQGMWMAYRLKALRGAYAEGETDKQYIYLCDFASAGNAWDTAQRYRVWLPRTLNARYDPFTRSPL